MNLRLGLSIVCVSISILMNACTPWIPPVGPRAPAPAPTVPPIGVGLPSPTPGDLPSATPVPWVDPENVLSPGAEVKKIKASAFMERNYPVVGQVIVLTEARQLTSFELIFVADDSGDALPGVGARLAIYEYDPYEKTLGTVIAELQGGSIPALSNQEEYPLSFAGGGLTLRRGTYLVAPIMEDSSNLQDDVYLKADDQADYSNAKTAIGAGEYSEFTEIPEQLIFKMTSQPVVAMGMIQEALTGIGATAGRWYQLGALQFAEKSDADTSATAIPFYDSEDLIYSLRSKGDQIIDVYINDVFKLRLGPNREGSVDLKPFIMNSPIGATIRLRVDVIKAPEPAPVTISGITSGGFYEIYVSILDSNQATVSQLAINSSEPVSVVIPAGHSISFVGNQPGTKTAIKLNGTDFIVVEASRVGWRSITGAELLMLSPSGAVEFSLEEK